MSRTVEVKCANAKCGAMFTARVSDRERGWAKFCSKSCKAVKQESQSHAFRNYINGRQSLAQVIADQCIDADRDANEDGWDGHKNAY